MSSAAHLLVGTALDRADGEPVTCGRKPSAVLGELLRHRREDRVDAWAILGRCNGNRRGRDRWEAASGVVLDFDYEDPSIPREDGAHQAIPPAERDRILAAVKDYPVSGYAYATPRGLRVGHVLAEDVADSDVYAELVESAAERMLVFLEKNGVPTWRRGVTGLRFDAASAQPWQPMRLPLVGEPTVLMGADDALGAADLRDDVPRLDLDRALPSDLADACRRIAAWVQIAPEVVVTGLLALASAAIGNTRWVVARGMTVPLSLHYLTVLLAGSGKSLVRKFLRDIVEEIERAVMERRHEARREREEYEERLEQWRADGRSKTSRSARGERPEPPALSSAGGERVSFIVSEATLEGIIATLEDTPRGILWATDEAHEVLGLLGRYGNDGARALDAARLRRLTESQPVEVHRARNNSSAVRRLPRPWLAIDADVQPGILAGLFAGEDRLSGLTARLLVHAPPNMQGRRCYVTPPPEPEPKVLEMLRERLVPLWREELELQYGVPHYAPLCLEPEAERLWAEELELLEQRYPGAGDEEAGVLGHARGRVLRFAGVLASLRDPQATHVTGEDTRRAIEHMRYHLAHHRRLLGAAEERDPANRLDRLREQAERILARHPEQGVRPSDLRRHVNRDRYDGEIGRRRALADLHAIGWILRRPAREAGRPGRPPVPAFFPMGAGKPSSKPPKPPPGPRVVGSGDSGDGADGVREHNGSAVELLDRASEQLLTTGTVQLPPVGRRVACPLCGSSDGLGVLPDEPSRWYCHSDRHQGGGCAVDLYLGRRLGRAPSAAEAVAEARKILGLDSHAEDGARGEVPLG